MTRDGPRKSLWIPYAFVGFFGLVLAANAVMVYFATTTFSGVHERRAYERGVAFNETLAAARAQAALGWTARLDYDPITPTVGRLHLRVADGDARPIAATSVAVALRRPTNAGLDFETALQPDGAGGYVTEVAWPATGVWDAAVLVEARGQRFRLDERLIVR